MATDYAIILDAAHKAAETAVAIASIKYDEMGGACGFVWVVISGNEPLARYCRKQLKALPINGTRTAERRPFGDKGYPSGWQFWNPGNHGGQRVDIKEAGAKAFALKLAEYGIRADWASRLD